MRSTTTLGVQSRQPLSIKVSPLNSKGERISLDYGVDYPLEKAYQHIRFGEPEFETRFQRAKLTTSKYGFDTVVYYDDVSVAQAAVVDGDMLDKITVRFPTVTGIRWLI